MSMLIHKAINIEINPDVTDIAAVAANDVELWSFPTDRIKIFVSRTAITIEAPGTIMDHQFVMSFGDYIGYSSAVVVDHN